MPPKDSFDFILPDFSTMFQDYLRKNGLNPNKLIITSEACEQMASVTSEFAKNISLRANEIYNNISNNPEIKSFYDGFHSIWDKCLELLDIHESMLFEIASSTLKVQEDEVNIKELVLSKLLGRSIRTYQEIIILLRNGYPYGANSLIRNLFEISMLIRFIEKNDKSVALAYYQSSDKPVDYNNKYEWARASGLFVAKENITLDKIRKLSGFEDEKFKELYTIYCNFVHAASQIINSEVGATNSDTYTGPTAFGIESAAIYAATFMNDAALSVIVKNASKDVHLKLMFCLEWGNLIEREFKRTAAQFDYLYEDRNNENGE